VVSLVAVVLLYQPIVQRVPHITETNAPALPEPTSPVQSILLVTQRAAASPWKTENPRKAATSQERAKDLTISVPEAPPLSTPISVIPMQPLIIPEDALKKTESSDPAVMSFRELPQPASPSAPNQEVGAMAGMLPRHTFAKPLAAFSIRRQNLWSIDSSAGTLRKSYDGGKTWTAIPVDGQTTLLALSASGSDIWAGGESGVLFRSVDNGSHWTLVPVLNGTERLTDAITGIEAHEPSIVKLKTQSGAWESSDGGVTWHKL